MKLQLRDLRQIHALPSIRIGAISSTAAHNVAAKAYRDVLYLGGGNPVSTAVLSGPNLQPSLPKSSVMASSDNPSVEGFVTVLSKRKGNHPSSIPSGLPNPPKRTRTPLFGVRSGSSLSTVQKRVRTKALYVSQFSPDVSSGDMEQSLKDQLELAFLTCTKLKTKFNSHSSFHISVSHFCF
jgi:hypothetical protein